MPKTAAAMMVKTILLAQRRQRGKRRTGADFLQYKVDAGCGQCRRQCRAHASSGAVHGPPGGWIDQMSSDTARQFGHRCRADAGLEYERFLAVRAEAGVQVEGKQVVSP